MSATRRLVDLRSDFLTRPTPAMLEAMNAACTRPWAFGLRDDPDQRALEEELATLLGHEDALIMPTSTMANQVALLLLTRPGEIVLGPEDLHLASSEAGAAAALAGIAVRGLGSHEPPLDAWRTALRALPDAQRSRIAAIALENTHNRAAGAAIDAATTEAILALARAHGVAAHLDGARLFNAAVATGAAPAALAAGFDTVTVSLNKGLGAPIGAALVASRSRVAEALILRQRLGGGIRPTAVFAAAARVAVAGWRDAVEDHRRAAAFATGIEGARGLSIVRPAHPTNIVVVEFEHLDADSAVAALAAAGVLAMPFGPRRLRFVIYRDIDDGDIARAVTACRALSGTGDGRTS